jgi:hypothetical protein
MRVLPCESSTSSIATARQISNHGLNLLRIYAIKPSFFKKQLKPIWGIFQRPRQQAKIKVNNKIACYSALVY